MAEYISFQPSDFYSTKLYTGNGVAIGSGGQAITGVGFAPNISWFKQFDASRVPVIFDTVRGVEEMIQPSNNSIEATESETLTTFGSDGFTLGNDAAVNTSSGNYTSWNWKCGTTSGIDTTGSTITPTAYSFNTTSGVSVVKYVGNATSGAKVAHGCGKPPFMIWFKNLDATANWSVYHQGMDPTDPGDYSMVLNDITGRGDNIALFNDTITDSVNFTLGDDAQVNGSTVNYIAYCFAQVPGFSKMGFFEGNGNTDGTFQYCGFRPAFIFIKDLNATTHYYMLDDKRGTASVYAYNIANNNYLQITDINAQQVTTLISFLSNGFKCRGTTTRINYDNRNFIYSAFAEFPLVSSNDVPGVAR